MGRDRRGAAAVAAIVLAAGSPAALAAAADPPAPVDVSHLCQVVEGFQPFTDIEGSPFLDSIACAAYVDVAQGGPGDEPDEHYGPGLLVTRAQMASFIDRMFNAAELSEKDDRVRSLPQDDGQPDFSDVPASSVHAGAIDRVSQAGIVRGGPQGRSHDEYGPELPVTRAQMASYLTRAVSYMTGRALTSDDDHFADDDGSPHETAIDGVAARGIAVGDGRDSYQPHRSVSREQMAAFLMRTLAAVEQLGDIAPFPAFEDTENVDIDGPDRDVVVAVGNPDDHASDDLVFSVGGMNEEEHRLTVIPAANVTVDAEGQLWFADEDDDRVVDTDGTSADITLVAGEAPVDNDGDGEDRTPNPIADSPTAVFSADGWEDITFTLDGDLAGETVRVIIHRNGGPRNRAGDGGYLPGLELRRDGTVAEEWAISEPVRFD